MEKELNFAKGIPQLRDVDAFLWQEAGFRLKTVHGILSQREFLNALGHRIFCSTQYIRSSKNPEYTPEPDIVHELVVIDAFFHSIGPCCNVCR
jgi:phenylalanine-4-hydroxylase